MTRVVVCTILTFLVCWILPFESWFDQGVVDWLFKPIIPLIGGVLFIIFYRISFSFRPSEKDMEDLQSQISEKDECVKQLENNNLMKDGQIDELRKQLQDKENRISRLEQTLQKINQKNNS